VCDLAESSPDRHLKVAACELLHSLVLVMIGNSAFQAKDTRHATESKYHGLYLRVFPVMLKLAIDVDQVARDMFRLLNSQIIHWLTNNAQYENPETIALLEACLEAACDTNAGLRDYGADCVQEFAKWSIKQSSSKSKNNPMNIKSLLKRLYNFMTNPNSSKRFGASLVFNRIYRLFREEESLIEEYTLEILGQLFFSLKLSESDHPSIGTSDQTREAISHIKRIIRRKSDLFIQESPTRRPFLELAVTDLGSVVEWTLMESGKDSRLYAKVCMDFFVEFIKLVPGKNSISCEWWRRIYSYQITL
jgi:hypothetical protein